VKRNAERFPEDFAFRLTPEEKMELVAKFDQFSRLKHSTVFPLVFTEHGAIMAANVLNSQRAIEASVYVVRAFVKMREALATHKELVRRLDEMEQKYDARFKVVFDAIRALIEPPAKPRRRIGYLADGKKSSQAARWREMNSSAARSRKPERVSPKDFAQASSSVRARSGRVMLIRFALPENFPSSTGTRAHTPPA